MRAFLLIALIALAALSQFGGGGGVLPIVPSGPKTAIIVYETEDTSVDLASLFTSLRHGPIAERIAKDGHQLLILDKDTKDERKQPLPLLILFGRQRFISIAAVGHYMITGLLGLAGQLTKAFGL